jgi:hypothetical protein
MHKEKAAWLKLQKTQQAQVTRLSTFLLIHASCKNGCLEVSTQKHHDLHLGVACVFVVANMLMAQEMQ